MTGNRNPIYTAGQRVCRLTLLQCIPSVNRSGERWVCKCECGTIKTVRRSGLLTGDSKSCGCLKRDHASSRFTKHGHAAAGKRTAEYNIWVGMRSRCRDQNYPGYCRYGGRGIAVCNRWEASFEDFLSDMGKRPTRAHSIDRIDNDGNYEPDNCRWATRTQQARNTRQVNIVEFDGKSVTLPDLAEKLNLNLQKVRRRLKSGWDLERAIS
jgi:hypothetical protein